MLNPISLGNHVYLGIKQTKVAALLASIAICLSLLGVDKHL